MWQAIGRRQTNEESREKRNCCRMTIECNPEMSCVDKDRWPSPKWISLATQRVSKREINSKRGSSSLVFCRFKKQPLNEDSIPFELGSELGTDWVKIFWDEFPVISRPQESSQQIQTWPLRRPQRWEMGDERSARVAPFVPSSFASFGSPPDLFPWHPLALCLLPGIVDKRPGALQ